MEPVEDVLDESRAGSLAAGDGAGARFAPTFSLECAACGYGIVRAKPPERCPMCQSTGDWNHTAWRPLTRAERLTW
jgi:rubrerythrin